MSRTRLVRVRLGPRSYTIHIGPDLLQRLPALLPRPFESGRPVWLVTDSRVARLHGAPLAARLKRLGHSTLITPIPSGERSKTAATLERLAGQGLAWGARRDVLLLALGGGVVGDVAGLLAGTYLRGVEWLQLPTTLLAQVDASVGGKVAVNVGRYKNSLGLFLQPAAVVADVAVLRTLPAREFRCGLAESVKMAAVLSGADFEWLERRAEQFQPDAPAPLLAELVWRSTRLKARVVERDERDVGRRALLNFGHTLGHALEGASGYRGLRHGEAVAVGSAFAAQVSAERGLLDPSELRRLIRLLQRMRLPTRAPRMDATRLLNLIRGDKKQARAGLAFVLTGPLGRGSVKRLSSEAELRAPLRRFLSGRAAKEGI